MPYTVNKSNGDILAVINDYRKEIIAGLNIMGYGFVNYGDDMAQNFVRMMDHFRDRKSPYNPILGQLWLDTRCDIPGWSIAYPVLRVCKRQATDNDEVNFVTTDANGNILDGSDWTGLFVLDFQNNRAGMLYNDVAVFPDVNPTPNTLVVRGSNGLVSLNNLPAIPYAAEAGHASLADLATNATNAASAQNAVNATNATNATNAVNATNATHANKAGGLDQSAAGDGTITIDANGKIYANIPAQAQLTEAAVANVVDGRYVNVTGDSMNGPLYVNGSGQIVLNTNGDITANRGDGTGVIFLGNGTRYLYFDSQNYQLPSSELWVNGGRTWTSANHGHGSGMDADTVDGLHASQIVAQATASSGGVIQSSLGGNGWAKFANGMMMQWGQYRFTTNNVSTVYTTPFNVAFSGPAWSVTMARYDPSFQTYNQKILGYRGSTDSYFQWKSFDNDSGNSGSYIYGFDWIAIGPS